MTTQYTAQWVEREYNNRALVPDHADYLNKWSTQSKQVRQSLTGMLNLRYGERAKQTLDLFPAARSRGLLVFLHGGYWRALDKDDFSWLAPPFVEQGISVAVVNYDLCPEITLEEIVAECCTAVQCLLRRTSGYTEHLVISGHSAGGHLTAMLMATDWPVLGLPQDVIKGGVSISGLFDLEPMLYFSYNADLRLDRETAIRLSPLHKHASHPAPLLLAVGELESSEFHRQSQAMFDAWPACRPQGMQAPLSLPDCHHFSALDQLAKTESQLFQATMKLFAYLRQ